MPEYKLTYYDLEGLGEPARYMFAVAGVEYEDYRISKDEKTYPKLPQAIKETLPWGTMPVLDVDDGNHRIAQSGAVFRFLARRFNLYGTGEFEIAKCDEIAEALKDFATAWFGVYMNPVEDETKQEALKKLKNETIPYYMDRFNKIAEKNGKWLVGQGLTWVDICLAHYMTMMVNWGQDPFVDKYPAVKKLVEDVYAVPQIKEWMAKRPKTEF